MLKVPHRLLEGCLDRGARDPVEAGLHLHPRRVPRGVRGRCRARSTRRATRASSASVEIVIHRGAGAYICGEETALLESLEGKRGQPRSKPPFPAISGVYASPTLINNVESITTIPADPRRRPGGVREDRRAARLDRHAALLPLGQRRAARRLRGAARDHGAASDRRHRRRRSRRPHAQGRDDGRLVVPGDDAGRPRHAARRRLARQEGLLHRLGRRDGDRRADVHRPVRAAGRAVLHARVVRQVHAVPRRHALARPAAARGRGRNRDRARPRPHARRLRPDHRQVPLRARRLGRDAGRELRDEVPRRVPRAPRARRLPLRRRLAARRAVRAGRPARAHGRGRRRRSYEHASSSASRSTSATSTSRRGRG